MYEELKARLLAWTKTSSSFGLDSIGKDIAKALEAIEELERQLAERDAEIAKYRDAPVVAWVFYPKGVGEKYVTYTNPASLDIGKQTDHIAYIEHLIVKPGE